MCTCANCQTVQRWEREYKRYLDLYPENYKWINQMRKMDKDTLVCFYKLMGIKRPPIEFASKDDYLESMS